MIYSIIDTGVNSLSPFRFVDCRRFGYYAPVLSPLLFVAKLVSPFWSVAVMVCRRFDHTPF